MTLIDPKVSSSAMVRFGRFLAVAATLLPSIGAYSQSDSSQWTDPDTGERRSVALAVGLLKQSINAGIQYQSFYDSEFVSLLKSPWLLT